MRKDTINVFHGWKISIMKFWQCNNIKQGESCIYFCIWTGQTQQRERVFYVTVSRVHWTHIFHLKLSGHRMPQLTWALPAIKCAGLFASSGCKYKFMLISPNYFWSMIRAHNIYGSKHTTLSTCCFYALDMSDFWRHPEKVENLTSICQKTKLRE